MWNIGIKRFFILLNALKEQNKQTFISNAFINTWKLFLIL